MKKLLFIIILGGTTLPAHAACYVDYKAKKDNPLKLHYGVAEVSDRQCQSRQKAANAVAPRLAKAGWTLLNVMSVFDQSGLAERKASAGKFFLRY